MPEVVMWPGVNWSREKGWGDCSSSMRISSRLLEQAPSERSTEKREMREETVEESISRATGAFSNFRVVY